MATAIGRRALLAFSITTGLLCSTSLAAAQGLPGAEGPPGLFREPPRAVPPSAYGNAAVEGDVDLSGVSQGARKIALSLPDGSSVELELELHQTRPHGDALWKGHVSGSSDSLAVLTTRRGRLAGRLRIAEDIYELRPGRGGQHRVEKLDPGAFPGCDTNHEDVPPGSAGDTGGGAQQSTSAADGGTVTIDLLSVYTPNARADAGGVAEIEALIHAAVDNANIAFAESNMSARFHLVHVAEIDYASNGDMGIDLRWVDDDPEVLALRDIHGADMVSLIVDTSSSCGKAWVQRNPGPGFEDDAFQVTDVDCAVGNLTFAHEHGHNMGFEHNPEDSSVGSDPSQASYPWSFAHWVNGSYRTVMSYSDPCSSGCTRVMRFSNPEVSYAGAPTGVWDERDNAHTGDLTAPIVAAFRQSVTAPPEGLVSVRIASPDDDVEESEADGTVYFDSSDLEFGYDFYVGADQVVGLRFVNVGIPQGATITDAYLEFTVDATGSEVANAQIRAEDVDDAAPFSPTLYDASNRWTTPSVVSWAIPAWNTVGSVQRSPDVSALVQEVVDRSGWSAGNAMVFLVDATGDREAEAYDSEPGGAALLRVEYTDELIPNALGIHEAEDAYLSGPAVASNQAGYSGSGFADYVNAFGDYVEWTVDAASAGDHALRFRYALSSGDRPLEISVNGQVVASSQSFPATGSFGVWSLTREVVATLGAGINKIRAAAIGSSGANVDYLEIAGAPASNVAPTAGFTVSTSDLTASFTDASTDGDGSVVSRSWSFGDGASSSAASPSHSYAVAGTYPGLFTKDRSDELKKAPVAVEMSCNTRSTATRAPS